MHKKAISFILISMFVFSVILKTCGISSVTPTSQTLRVPTQYLTIRAAVDAANSGDIIEVEHGFYNEHVIVNKTLWLIGENPSNTIIDGSGTGNHTVIVTKNADNVKIEGFTIQKGDNPFESASMSILGSKGHMISNNIIRQSSYGLRMGAASESYITNNVIANNTATGIYFSSSSRNNVVGNLFEKNSVGVRIADTASRDNSFYRNSFVNNTEQVQVFGSAKWDNGAEGNYWSDYIGQDLNSDGIGDTGVPHLGKDRFPLMERWSETRDFPSTWHELTYHTIVRCNSTVASFRFTYSLAQISFNVTGPQNALSFCNVTVDKLFLDGSFTVLIDMVSRSYVLTQNITHSFLHFTFSHSAHRIQIRGTKVVGNIIPTANFAYSPAFPVVNGTVTFNASSSYDSDGAIMNYTWNFGDGSTASQQNPVHKYTRNGTFTVTLTVADNEGATNTLTKTIVVSLSPPDYTFYYILLGIVAGALILGATFFLLKKMKKKVQRNIRQKRSRSK